VDAEADAVKEAWDFFAGCTASFRSKLWMTARKSALVEKRVPAFVWSVAGMAVDRTGNVVVTGSSYNTPDAFSENEPNQRIT